MFYALKCVCNVLLLIFNIYRCIISKSNFIYRNNSFLASLHIYHLGGNTFSPEVALLHRNRVLHRRRPLGRHLEL